MVDTRGYLNKVKANITQKIRDRERFLIQKEEEKIGSPIGKAFYWLTVNRLCDKDPELIDLQDLRERVYLWTSNLLDLEYCDRESERKKAMLAWIRLRRS